MTAEVTKLTTYLIVGPEGTGPAVSKFTMYTILGPNTGATANEEATRLRVWGFSLDGHDFYVLRVGASETLVYDLTTDCWAHWASPGSETWRAHVGGNWVGMGNLSLDRDFGTDVVAGDDTRGLLWILDPTTGLDDNVTTGSTTFTRKVVAGVPLKGREVFSCGAVQIDAALGYPNATGAAITLRTSDDFGQTFTNHGTVVVTSGDYTQILEWRSLGLMRQPGRLFEFSDDGAAVRLSGAVFR